jgi:hypothetical protein
MFNLAIIKSQVVEAQFQGSVATGRRYNFTEVPNISRNNLLLYGFEAYTADQLSVAPSGNTVVASADANQILVTLKDIENEEFVYQYPVFNLIRSNTGGFVTIIQPRVINLTDCFVELTDTTGVSADEVIAFNLFYNIV